MTSPRVYIAVPLVLALAGTGYWLYNANAIQAGGSLAQVPLNSSVTVPPAFVMAVDNSGSMTFQTLFPGKDGAAFWENDAASTNGFFIGTGVNARPRTQNDSKDLENFHHTIPSNGYRIADTRYAIPPIDNFGFARSPDVNPAYFNPAVTYAPWKRPNASNEIVDYPAASITDTRVDPDLATPTINLASNWRMNGGDNLFMVPNGATLPKDTVYYSDGNCGGLRGGSWRTLNSAATVNEDCEISIEYYPATFYLKSATAGSAWGYTATPTLAKNACGSGCDLYKYEIRSGNYSAGKYALAIQNFANWFSFYGNRNRAMKAALTLSLERTEKMRVGMFTINPTSYTDVVMRDMSVAADKAALYNDKLLKLNASGGTPNRFAVEHVGKQFLRTDAGAPVKYACQINAGMLFTDGYSNTGGPAVGSHDADMPAPLADAHANTLADTAAFYYKATLRSDLGLGKVPVPEACKTTPNDPKLDCRADPHMNFYGVTLGARGDIYGVTYNPLTNTPDPYTPAGYPAWRSRQDDAPSTVDEIWHATMNARGKYVNATTPADITSAMREILASVGGGATPWGTIGLVGARVGSNTLSVEPIYESANNGTDWFGRLTAYTASHDPVAGTITFAQKWEAASLLTDAGRSVRFGKTTAGSVKPTVGDFTATALGSTDTAVLGALCSDALQNCAGKFNRIDGGVTGAEAVAYLRGSRAHDGGKLRKRTTLLGDIVNSSPILSSKGDDYGYRGLRSADGLTPDALNYANYLDSKRTSRKTFVYVGANDGMFHAFDGETGKEQFAYIPATSVGHMGNLLFPYRAGDRNDQVFQHRYYVDGQVTVSDAHNGSAWKTVLAASVGAGGRGVFALDVTDQSALNVLWEVNDLSGDANGAKDIGSVLGKIAIVPVKEAGGAIKWKAIFGNGYDSVNGKAVLFLVDVADGKVTRITAQETTGTLPTRTKNGLGNVVVIDRYQGTSTTQVRDGFADTVYAGDLNGAVWKFDLRDNSVGFGGQPLFIARYNDNYALRQPILGGLEATTVGNDVMVLFGTGSFSFTDDPGDKAMQSVYGIIDKGAVVAGRNELQPQYVKEERDTTGAVLRFVTGDRLNATKKGWYINLGVDAGMNGNPVATGERFIGKPRLQNGILFFPTYDPNSTDGCSTDGNNWLYGVDALSGGAGLSNGRIGSATGSRFGDGVGAVKLKRKGSGTGTAPVTEVSVAATGASDILPVTATEEEIAKAVAAKCSVMVQTSGSQPIYLPRPCGRQSWRQIR
ncbi:putative PilY1 protein [Lysobacter antibioticus]|uniref:pilus assembly protein n=1 Tax=Lysobacter antibioticus TaxID=84531 RepID=UPI0007174A90|nr:PilC/PilY family type IV pilus protein [Lysobacter antibioticus]ALN65100.1 putative PilY1 protein [Lysobacter antibioticus]